MIWYTSSGREGIVPSTRRPPRAAAASMSGASSFASTAGTWPTGVPDTFLTWMAFPSYALLGCRTSVTFSPSETTPS